MLKYFYIKKRGFTLVELLIVIAIIALLTTLSTIYVGRARVKAQNAKAQHEVDQIANAIIMLGNDTLQWPGHQDANQIGSAANNEFCGPDINANNCGANILSSQIAGIVANDAGNPYPAWGGPYMTQIKDDPWGRQYYFDTDYRITVDGNPCAGAAACVDGVVVGSYGPDGQGKPDGTSAGAYGADDIIKVILR